MSKTKDALIEQMNNDADVLTDGCLESLHNLLFSKRIAITDIVEKWCLENNIEINTFNIITVLCKLGYITEDISTGSVSFTVDAEWEHVDNA